MASASVASSYGVSDDRQQQGGQSVQSNQGNVHMGQSTTYAQPSSVNPPAWGGTDYNSVTDNSNISSMNYYGQYDQSIQPPGNSSASTPSSSATGYEGYSGYNSYSASYNPNYPSSSYGSTSYPPNYNSNYGFSHQGNTSYSQPVGAYQNSTAPYQQPSNSYQNASSYTDSTSYQNSAAYYGTGTYQNTEGYGATAYGAQIGSWSDTGYGNYGGYQGYAGYNQADYGSNQTQTQDYQQAWQEYYKQQPDTDVSCAPGTEPPVGNTTGNASAVAGSVPSVSNDSSPAVAQPPPPGTHSSWQSNAATYYDSSMQQAHYASYYQQPAQPQTILHQSQEQHHAMQTEGPTVAPVTSELPAHNISPSSVKGTHSDNPQRNGKIQIPTNPRIAPNLPYGTSDTSKRKFQASTPIQKPSYTKVNTNAFQSKPSSSDVADAMIKPGLFPPALCHYVERALARCKDESQKTASQGVMKEIITKASEDGTLFSRDWDTEPLFPLPVSNSGLSSDNHSPPIKDEHTQTKRFRSRWEPIIEEKPEKQHGFSHGFVKGETWNAVKAGQNKVSQNNGAWNKFERSHGQESLRMSKRVRNDGSTDRNTEMGDSPIASVNTLSSRGFNETLEEKKRRESRSKRFENGATKTKVSGYVISKDTVNGRRVMSKPIVSKNEGENQGLAVEDIDWDSLTIKGTCQDIEKRYLRLTSVPDPDTVRPEDVLHQALATVQSSPKNYFYKCDQLKSIRQDLTVQRIRNDFTVKVYETHGRLAIEAGDLAEYNQCQALLRGLYSDGLKGCNYEFAAYKVLSACLISGDKRDLQSSMARLSNEAKRDELVKHAMAVRAAVSSGNYTSFFRLYKTASSLSACLMDLYIENMRFEALKCISRAYRPTVPVSFITQTLGFKYNDFSKENGESDCLEICEEWLRGHGAVIITDESTGDLLLNAKDSISTLYLPDPEDAVAHGDASLAVNDFLTRT